MKTFLPHYLRKVGIALFLVSILVSAAASLDDPILKDYKYEPNNAHITNSNKLNIADQLPLQIWTENQRADLKISGFILCLSALLLYSFSKEKIDDEFLVKLRANALLKSFVISWFIFAVIMLVKSTTRGNLLSILQIQMFIYVLVYAYTKKVKYAE